MGSVKDLIVIKKPSTNTPGVGRFIFSDRYSVFDWGEMPDHIEGKGEAICLASAYFFEEIEKRGIKTHYKGVVEGGGVKFLKELSGAQNVIEFELLQVEKPKLEEGKYDYSTFSLKKNCLLPLEIIYRNSLPEGSSVFKRLKEGRLRLEDIGLKKYPSVGEILSPPLIEVSTKFEAQDRYISWEEAQKITKLTDTYVEKMKEITLEVNKIISEKTEKLGLVNEDGKLEFGLNEKGELILVDAVGTLDECRFKWEDLPISKEIARIYYRGTEFFEEINKAKTKSPTNWKAYVKSPPNPLPSEWLTTIIRIYKSYTNELTGRNWFDVPPLKEVVKKLKSLIKENKR